jgi:predicted amidohydrolase
MKICAAQAKPLKGDINNNIQGHISLIGPAIAESAGLIIFPELSITGYEPSLARELAMKPNDPRLSVFQEMSEQHQVIIGVGIPEEKEGGIAISTVYFLPGKERMVYSKQYLHGDELPYFINGREQLYLEVQGNKIAPSICYELSVPAHARVAAMAGANVYLSSVAKTAEGVDKAMLTLSETAASYGFSVIMANCTGDCDNFKSDGRSAAWNNRGKLLGQLNNYREGMLILDTDTDRVTSYYP